MAVQAHLYKSMIDHGVYMEGTTLKPNMVNPGKNCPKKYTAEEIGKVRLSAAEGAGGRCTSWVGPLPLSSSLRPLRLLRPPALHPAPPTPNQP